ncbi:cytochrome c oxidase subunit II [Pseudofulvimonas gallinarii]|uniref:Cytochrome c oxidase subunit 2 n=1 Tax=Pseudofulvimonas gallinarii TaxID=634155 RepID=A0A4S3KVG5_9GAMM|nr:cytochrome c oxidase subunit II [Pseudofulvimonas gallinarii]TCS93786.1 cytochrome c oxidase subunit 2 [Pseudofulvimonas gallinarii]THD13249.1 cytochrome c oxidase subunit II [Pseudofulvimonas gallinarii]
MTPRRVLAALAILALTAVQAQANPEPWQLNMSPGVTETSRMVYDIHMLILWICVVIGVLVFGAMGYAILKFRKSKGAVPAKWSHNTTAEIIWTVIPVLILVGMAWPATNTLIHMADTDDAELTVKITGYQWLWRYEYVGTDVNFVSKLDRDSDRTRMLGSGLNPADVRTGDQNTYLLNVDNPLVLPTGTKVRFVITANDVIHAWWVPVLGWKQDAIPGFINEAWTRIDTPGTYRGQCAELCGKDHGFMPIVVEAVPREQFDAWLAQKDAEAKAAATAANVPATGDALAVVQ